MAAPALSLPQKLRYGAETAFFLAFMGLFRLIGLDAASALGGWIGRLIIIPSTWGDRARRNLAFAFPEKTQAEREAIIRAMSDNLGRTVAEYAHLDKFDIGGRNPRLRVENGAIAATVLHQGVIMVSGHFANWEVMQIAAAEFGLQGGIVYRPLTIPILIATSGAPEPRRA